MAVQVKLRVLLDSIQPLEQVLVQTALLELTQPEDKLILAQTAMLELTQLEDKKIAPPALLESIKIKRDKQIVTL